MKISAFNVKNLFEQASILNEYLCNNSTDVITNVAKLNELYEKPTYCEDDKERILELLEMFVFNRYYDRPFALIRRNQGSISNPLNKFRVEVGWRIVPHPLLMSYVHPDQE